MNIASQYSLESQIAKGLERIQTAYRCLYQKKATELSLTPLQIQIILTLTSYPEGMSLNYLSRHLKLTPATLSDAVRTLANKKLVQKTVSPADARFINLTLTSEGRKISASSQNCINSAAKSLDTLSPAQKKNFIKILTSILGQLKKYRFLDVARTCAVCANFNEDLHRGRKSVYFCNRLGKTIDETELRADCSMFEDLIIGKLLQTAKGDKK